MSKITVAFNIAVTSGGFGRDSIGSENRKACNHYLLGALICVAGDFVPMAL